MAVLVVLLMLAMVLSLSYAAMRSRFAGAMVGRNAERQIAARQAAMSGLAIAMRRMHVTGWTGVGSSLGGSLGDGTSYLVTFSAGDPALTSASADYAEWPLRVTLSAKGYAQDGSNPQCVATHEVQSVVRLVPRALNSQPTGFSDLVDHTVCQWTNGDFVLTPPCRFAGPVRVRATMDLGWQILWNFGPRWHYFDGLNRLNQAGQGDWRPFSGTVKMPYSWQYPDTRVVLNTALGVATQDTSSTASYVWTSPSSAVSYKLYEGGASYTPTTLPQEVNGITLEPDPKTNPLGMYYRAGLCRIQQNVSITGTLITLGGSTAKVEFNGSGVRLQPVELPPLAGTTEPIRLPTLVSADDVVVKKGAGVEISGMIIVRDDFLVEKAALEEIVWTHAGRLAARDVYIEVRKRWDEKSTWWSEQWIEYWNQRELPGGTDNFAVWLNREHALSSVPNIQITSDARSIRYHWQNPANPVFVPAAGDSGLRWEMVKWKDNP